MDGLGPDLTLKQAPLRRLMARWASGHPWRGPAMMPRAGMALIFLASAAYAGSVALVTNNELHRMWGIFALSAYLIAALAVLVWKSRGQDVALAASVGGAVVLPLSLMAIDRLQQPEVAVINQSAWLLVHHGNPYLTPAVLAAAHNTNAFDPYLPLMTAFGLAHALLGPSILTDPRIWFGLGFVALFAAALAASGVTNVARWTVFVAASPVIAFSLTVGGTDVPVFACQCLGLALLWRRPRTVASGIAFGAAAAMKATAWPALAVAVVLLAARDGKRAAASMLLTALAVVALIVGPVASLWPGALVQNTILFPLGLASVGSEAVSPLPGRLLAETGHAGHVAAVALLVVAGLALGISMVIRPPRTVPAAIWRLIIGLSLMVILAPATRFGYFLYPLGLLAWLAIAHFTGNSKAPEADPGVEGQVRQSRMDQVLAGAEGTSEPADSPVLPRI